MKGILQFIPQFFYSPDDNVQMLPEVPSPSESDVDELSGDDDDDAEGDDDDLSDDDADGDEDADEDGDDADEDADEEGNDDKEKDEDKEKPPKKKKKQKDDVIDEDADKEDDKEDDKDDDKEVVGDKTKIPSLKALKTAYPDIFKKFPHVRTAIAEHQQFRAIHGSVDEARDAVQAQQDFFDMSEKLLDQHDFGYLLGELDKADPQASNRLVKNILPTILERSKDLYMEITEFPIKQFVHAAFRRARADNNKNLENSALHLWKFLGMDGAPSLREEGPDPRDKEFQEKVRTYEENKRRDASTSVNNDIRSSLVTMIERSIDPKNVLKETTKRALVNELIRAVDTDVAGDQNHMSRVERLWANARRSSYANGHLSRIINAYLERAKQVLPKHAQKVRDENNISADEPKNKERDDRREARGGRRESNEPAPRPHSSGAPPRQRTIRDTNPRDIDWQRTSDEDVLGGKAVLRRR